MENGRVQGEDDFPVIGEVLDAVKTARYQFGTLAHMGDDMERSLSGVRAWRKRLQLFLSDRSRHRNVAAAVIATAAVLSFARGWLSVARARHSAFALKLDRSLRYARQQQDRLRRRP